MSLPRFIHEINGSCALRTALTGLISYDAKVTTLDDPTIYDHSRIAELKWPANLLWLKSVLHSRLREEESFNNLSRDWWAEHASEEMPGEEWARERGSAAG